MLESLFAPLLLAAASPGLPEVADNVAMFEVTQMGNDVAVMAIGIIEDSRCADQELCFQTERLAVSAAIADGPQMREVVLELGVPLQLNNGTLLLASTSTLPSDAGAIELADYSLDLIFTPATR